MLYKSTFYLLTYLYIFVSKIEVECDCLSCKTYHLLLLAAACLHFVAVLKLESRWIRWQGRQLQTLCHRYHQRYHLPLQEQLMSRYSRLPMYLYLWNQSGQVSGVTVVFFWGGMILFFFCYSGSLDARMWSTEYKHVCVCVSVTHVR